MIKIKDTRCKESVIICIGWKPTLNTCWLVANTKQTQFIEHDIQNVAYSKNLGRNRCKSTMLMQNLRQIMYNRLQNLGHTTYNRLKDYSDVWDKPLVGSGHFGEA